MPPGSQRYFNKGTLYWFSMLSITAFLVISSLWVVRFVIASTSAADEEIARTTPAYVNYWTGQGYITDEASAAIQAYILEHPEPQNVKVLTGISPGAGMIERRSLLSQCLRNGLRALIG